MEYKDETFSISLNGTKLAFQGKIEKSNYEDLSSFLKKVDDSVKETEMQVDLRQLDFLNSSGIRSLAVFFLESKKNIRIIIDPGKTWQKVGITPLESLREAGKVKVTE